MSKLSAFLILFCLATISNGQIGKVNLPQLIPPSPEAFSISKGGQLSVGMFTGAPSASIPLYDFKLRNLSIPITLNYSSNGLKVDEIPGRSGLGWNLSIGGSVNRIVHGKPDDESDLEPYPTNGNSLANYFTNVTNQSLTVDAEADEFSVNAPGLSARFILDKFNNATFIPHSNLKVEVLGGSGETNPFQTFIVTTTEGIKYRFGGTGSIETTISHNMNGQSVYRQQVRTAFFLKSIRLPEGDSITYSYSPVRTSAFTGISQGVRKGFVENLTEFCECNNVTVCPGPYVDAASFNEQLSDVMYSTVYLTQIKGPNGLFINLEYEDRPDGSGDKRIAQIKIRAPFMAKVFRLIYYDPSTVGYSGGSHYNAGQYNKRFFLKEVQSIKRLQGNIPADTVKYTLDYEDINNLPPRLSFAQDALGFYNGANNTYFLPVQDGQSGYWGAYATADRSFRGSMAVKGMLRKITYPTGGYDEFIYEPNFISVLEGGGPSSQMVTKSTTGSGTSIPQTPTGIWDSIDYYTDTLLSLQAQTATITVTSFKNPGCEECTQAPSNTRNLAWIKLMNITDNTIDQIILIRTDTTGIYSANLLANKVYKLKLTVIGLPNAAYTEIRYSKAPANYNGSNYYVDKEAGGVRVKEIHSYEPLTGQLERKFYKYHSKLTPERSSGISLFKPEYLETTNYREDCSHGGTELCTPPKSPPAGDHVECNFYVLSSSSLISTYLFDNNHIAYQFVLESNDPSNLNGFTEHVYDVNFINNRTHIMGLGNNFLPTNTAEITTGYELRTSLYSSGGSPVKETFNYYSHSFVDQKPSYSIRRRYSIQMFDDNNIGEPLNPWDVTQYDYQSNWIKLDSTVSIDYANGTILRNKVVHYYNSSSNILPQKTESLKSNGEWSQTEYLYPTDRSNLFPYNRMVYRNNISPVIEQIERKISGNTSVELARIKYYFNSPNDSIFRADSIQRSFLATPLTTEARFLYDSKGNIKEMLGKDGVVKSYLWGYESMFPVAEIIGKGYSQVLTESGINLNDLVLINDESGSQTELNKLRSLSNVLVTTRIYRPYTGITVQSDTRSKNMYYFYDNLGRLSQVKDNEGNILSKNCYTYAGRQEYCATGCSNTNPSWLDTGAPARCQTNSEGQNSGAIEQEQLDTNNCSYTYGQTRWIVTDSNRYACPLYDTVTIQAVNNTGEAGYVAVFVNKNTGMVKNFNIPAGSGTQNLGPLLSGSYTVTIYKPNYTGNISFQFTACSQSFIGISATFSTVNVSGTCKTVTISAL